ncbi:MAG TPA: RagB/SusD family nutrient uptake outer membrane protein, partial [Pedobacter sp.]|nr:RagB/SusD family nutrient uptake outer membrane protein [Pedobacter sp.]
MKNAIKKTTIFMIIGLVAMNSSCKKFIDIDPPKSSVTSEVVFNDDVTATSAVVGIYFDLINYVGFASGGPSSVTMLAGLSADELHNFSNVGVYQEFQQNNLSTRNASVLELWISCYKTLYQINEVLEGLNESRNVTEKAKKQLIGEVLFIRAFTHFYLVNLFGPIPLALTTDYNITKKLPRSTSFEVYNSIIQDLTIAKNNLSDDYPWIDEDFVTRARIRVNKASAAAMLARVYLYNKQWDNAETQATEVINNSKYALSSDLNTTFLSNSSEAIWQLRPVVSESSNTVEGFYFLEDLSLYKSFVLNNEVTKAFEYGDLRKNEWIRTDLLIPEPIYSPYKYKVYTSSTVTESSMVLRLSEQYLIRA